MSNSWVSWYLALKGNEYFCEVDDDYILDRFNLTGLNAEVQNYPLALDLITDALDEDYLDAPRDHIEAQGRLLYGLVHARYILTTRGLAKMLDKYRRGEFGRCPRVLCYGQQLLPVGLSDLPFQKAVKLYCARCEDIYSPKSSRHGTIDGAFFGSTFPHMLFMVYPHLLPAKSPSAPSPFLLASSAQRGGDANDPSNADDSIMNPNQQIRSDRGTGTAGTSAGAGAIAGGLSSTAAGAAGESGGNTSGSTAGAASKVERYRPRIFGFPVHETSVLHKWQERQRDRQIERLEAFERDALAAQYAASHPVAAAAARESQVGGQTTYRAAAAASAAAAAGTPLESTRAVE